jgi:hypothetical protein
MLGFVKPTLHKPLQLLMVVEEVALLILVAVEVVVIIILVVVVVVGDVVSPMTAYTLLSLVIIWR